MQATSVGTAHRLKACTIRGRAIPSVDVPLGRQGRDALRASTTCSGPTCTVFAQTARYAPVRGATPALVTGQRVNTACGKRCSGAAVHFMEKSPQQPHGFARRPRSCESDRGFRRASRAADWRLRRLDRIWEVWRPRRGVGSCCAMAASVWGPRRADRVARATASRSLARREMPVGATTYRSAPAPARSRWPKGLS